MKRKGILLTVLLIVLALFVAACGGKGKGGTTDGENPSAPSGPFDFDGNYVAPELTIDGKGDDAQWQAITEPLAVYGHDNAVSVKAYRGEKAMFFLYDVRDTILLTNGNANDDTVNEGDSVELYIDTLADGGLKPRSDDFQINLGIHGKTRIMQGADSQWGSWNGLIDYEVALNGTLNDGAEATDIGYGLEVMVPYAQIGIEKNDTVGIAFGHVDKIALGNENKKDWDWYGWTYNGQQIEPQTIDNYVLWDKDGNLLSRDDQEKPDVEIGGTVLDANTKQFVEGATVTTTVGGEEKSVETDGNGFFSFGKVSSNETYTVTISKSGYIANEITYTRGELRAANGAVVVKTVELTALADAELTTVTGTVKNVLRGTVEGARVRIDGTALSELTDSEGVFTIENVPVSDTVTLVVTKEGFGESKTTVARSALTVGGTSALGDVNLNLPYAELGTIGAGLNFFANTTVKLSRTLSGIEVQLVGTQTFAGWVEIYIDTKASADHRDKDSTCWQFVLDSNGSLRGTHYTTTFDPNGLEYNLINRSENGYEATLFIPYDYLGINALEVFGVTAGHWSTTANSGNGDWQNLVYSGAEKATEVPQNYLRIAADNTIYTANTNNVSVALSGNVGVSDVTVKAGTATAVSQADGSWQLPCAVDAAQSVTVEYSRAGYVSASTVIPAGTFFTEDEWSENKTLVEQKVTVSGTVTNRNGGAGVADVAVTATVTKSDGTTEELRATTGNDGSYTIQNVLTFADVTFTFTHADYERETATVTTATFMGLTDAHTLDMQMSATADIVEVTVSGTVVDINGIVADATVTIQDKEGAKTPTVTNGAFSTTTIGTFTVTVSKEGYITKEIAVTLDDLSGDTHSLGNIFLARNYTALGGTISDLTGYVTRDENAFLFKFAANGELNGAIELFVDTKSSNGYPYRDDGTKVDARKDNDYRFDLKEEGVSIVNFGGGSNTTVPSDMTYTISGKEGVFVLPYSFINIARDEIIGISLGYIPAGSAWTGWTHETLKGANGDAFVKPEMTADYLRIGVDNVLFENGVNYTTDVLDVRDYEIQFGMNSDMFYAKVDRDTSGVTFSFVTLGDFNKNGDQNEMVLLYFDFVTDTQHKGTDWTNGADYLLKIASDGTVYGSNGEGKPKGPSWWSATNDDKTGDTVTIDRTGGITKFALTLTYDKLAAMGLGSNDEIFGIVMREASHNAGDHTLYDPWYDCYFDGVCRDAAAKTEFIRVAANGTLYTATDNNSVTPASEQE